MGSSADPPTANGPSPAVAAHPPDASVHLTPANLPDQPRDASRLTRNRGLAFAVVAWIGYTLIAALAAGILLVWGGLAHEHTDTKALDPLGNVVSETKESKDSVPILTIFTALAAGGWLLIPLKFAWDEIAKNRDSERLEQEHDSDARRERLKSDEDNRRQIESRMRDMVSESITKFYGPMLYRQSAIRSRAVDVITSTTDIDQKEAQSRLLYAIARLYELYDQIREAGAGVLLRSKVWEQAAAKSDFELMAMLKEFVPQRYELELVKAIRSPRYGNTQYVDYLTFRGRLNVEVPGWAKLYEVHQVFAKACATPDNLTKLSQLAQAAQTTLQKGQDNVFREWYRIPDTLPG